MHRYGVCECLFFFNISIIEKEKYYFKNVIRECFLMSTIFWDEMYASRSSPMFLNNVLKFYIIPSPFMYLSCIFWWWPFGPKLMSELITVYVCTTEKPHHFHISYCNCNFCYYLTYKHTVLRNASICVKLCIV
jgi:hypothetical protein